MEYKKIENEIDNLLHNGGLNPYERKLLRKVKRKMCKDNDSYDSLQRLNCFMDSEIKRLEQENENISYEKDCWQTEFEEQERKCRLKDKLIEEYLKEWQKEKEKNLELERELKLFKWLCLFQFCCSLFIVFYGAIMR